MQPKRVKRRLALLRRVSTQIAIDLPAISLRTSGLKSLI
jgi:hypothetical protein